MSGINIPGTVIASKITTGNTANTFATMDVNEAQGGFMQVQLLAERDAITPERRKAGMHCYVQQTNKDYKLGVDLLTWTEVSYGGDQKIYYDIASCALGNPTSAGGSVELMRFIATRNYKLLEGCPNSVAMVAVGPSVPLSFPLLYNNVQFGSMDFERALPGEPLYATFVSNEQQFNPRDILTVMSPQQPDAQIRDIEWNIAAILY